MNSVTSRFVLESINPTVHFQVGDVGRLPVLPVASADEIYAMLDRAFTEHESARENSVEFHRPGPSPWRHAQIWAQRSVDRPDGAPLPPYEPEYDPPAPGTFLSFAAGVALGRFGAQGEGILDASKSEHHPLIDSALPHGILFLSASTESDSLDHPASVLLHETWRDHGALVGHRSDLRTYLRLKYFDYHRKLYENRPVYFPLSSSKKTFVAWISIHCWRSDTLQTLLADHLMPERRRLDGELEDLRKARAEGKSSNATEKRFDQLKKALDELEDFITAITNIADAGPPPTDAQCPSREIDARFEMDLDDGVMVNSAALWPLFAPQWAKPKMWWNELATSKGKKDYDWSLLAARYFPDRVDAKCRQDPSLGVAHGCFWRYHPAKAYQWELRLQDEIAPDFTIDEEGSDDARARFLAEHRDEAAEILTKETKRREKKRKKEGKDAGGVSGPLFDGRAEANPEN